MRMNKIVPFSVVILLITVSFAGVASAVQLGTPTPTQLSAAATTYYGIYITGSVAVGMPFTINGTLTDANGNPIAGATIQLQNSTDNVNWNNVTTATTNANGAYQLGNNESAVNTYYYRTTYAGSTTYTNATSNVVSVTVTKIPTTLTATASAKIVAVNQQFTVSGTLKTQGTPSTALVSQPVYLEGSYDNITWFRISANATTKAGGAYSFAGYISQTGSYYLRAHFDGTATYAGSVSNAILVRVVPPPT